MGGRGYTNSMIPLQLHLHLLEDLPVDVITTTLRTHTGRRFGSSRRSRRISRSLIVLPLLTADILHGVIFRHQSIPINGYVLSDPTQLHPNISKYQWFPSTLGCNGQRVAPKVPVVHSEREWTSPPPYFQTTGSWMDKMSGDKICKTTTSDTLNFLHPVSPKHLLLPSFPPP